MATLQQSESIFDGAPYRIPKRWEHEFCVISDTGRNAPRQSTRRTLIRDADTTCEFHAIGSEECPAPTSFEALALHSLIINFSVGKEAVAPELSELE